MKKLLILLLLVGAGVGALVGTRIVRANQLSGLVAALAEFKLPENPYSITTTEKLFVRELGKHITKEVTKPWEFGHDKALVVRACWAQRADGVLPAVLDLVKDATKPANQRIAGMLVLGKCKDAKKEDRPQIISALVAQLATPAERVAEFAAFSLGLLGLKDVDAAVSAAAAAGSDESKYFCLVALRDNREAMDKNKPFDKAAGLVVLAALSSGHAPTRKLATMHAHWVKGETKETVELINKLVELLKDPDQAIADIAKDSIRQKVTELDASGDESKALRAGLPAVVESTQAYTRANAVWVGYFLNNNAASGAGIGKGEPADLSLSAAAWEKDASESLVLAAAAADLGRHGSLEQKLKVAKLLQQDGCAAPLAEAARDGLAAMAQNKGDALLVGALLEALGKGGPGAAAAGRLMGVHGSKKEHALAMIEALKTAADDVAKAGLIEGLQALLNDRKAKTPEQFAPLVPKSTLK